MIGRTTLLALLAITATPAPPSVAAMHWHRRILMVASPAPNDPQAEAQRRILADWDAGAKDRDLSLVELSGARVTGASDTASSLAKKFNLKPDRFQVLLIGKDGTVALRSSHPLSAQILQGTIDAMPMRRAGDR